MFGLVSFLIPVRRLFTHLPEYSFIYLFIFTNDGHASKISISSAANGCIWAAGRRPPWSGIRFPRGSSLALTVVTQLSWSGAHRVTAPAELAGAASVFDLHSRMPGAVFMVEAVLCWSRPGRQGRRGDSAPGERNPCKVGRRVVRASWKVV